MAGYLDYGFGPPPKRRRRRQPTMEQQIGLIEADIADVAKLWEHRGQRAYKKYKKTKKQYQKAKKDYAVAKAEGRDPYTLTKHYVGKAKRIVHPKRSIYHVPKKGMASKLKELFKKKKGVYK